MIYIHRQHDWAHRSPKIYKMPPRMNGEYSKDNQHTKINHISRY